MSDMRRRPSRWIRFAALVVVALLSATACRAETQTTLMFDPSERTELADDFDQAQEDFADDTELADQSGSADDAGLPGDTATDDDASDDSTDEAGTRGDQLPSFDGGGVDPTLERDDVSCTEDSLNDEPQTPFVVAHYVVDGNLGAACYGEEDQRLLRAWEVLAAITPPGQLQDLGLFGGYVSTESGETTLAFVNELDLNGSLYQMSINLDEAEADPDELMLTMAHEFSHVFAQLPTELDRTVRQGECDTYYNGVGCFVPGSLMAEWIEIFWGELIEEIDPNESPTGAEGEARCNVNPSFLGAYAASNPEEDFAETFSAYVFRLEVESSELQAKLDWFADQPGLVEFQDRAIQAGYGPLNNEFGVCG